MEYSSTSNHMFKKPPQPKPSSNIKSSERRQLLAEVCKTFQIEKSHLSKQDELALVPATIKQASYQSIQGHKGTIYFDSAECPVWFRPRDQPLYPSIYTLWRAAYLLPIVLTNSHVIGKLTNHANLMLPGCIPPFDARAVRGAMVAVASYEKPSVVMAIGHCSLNLTQFDNVVGRTGTAVTIVHSYDDELFRLYDEDVPVPDSVSTEMPTIEEEEEEEEVGEGEAGGVDGKAGGVDGVSGGIDGVSGGVEEDTAQQDADNLAESVSELSVEDTEHLFIRAFIQSVKVGNVEVPITASKIMSDHILKNFPRSDPKFCNIKRTLWKKSAKFLKALEKLKYLSLKGKGDDVTVVAITISPEIVANFVPHKTMDDTKGSGATPSKKDLDTKFNVVHLYKPTNKSRMVFNTLDKNYTALYTKQDLKTILNDYIKTAQLADKSNPKMVTLDSALLSMVAGSAGSAPRDKLLTSFINSFSPHYAVLRPQEDLDSGVTIHRGEPPKIKILTQTVLGRKKTTSVSNFETYHIKPNALAEELKSLCSGSTSVGNSVHNPAITEVMVQGPHGALITDYLKKKGVPVGYIEFEDKGKGKKKR